MRKPSHSNLVSNVQTTQSTVWPSQVNLEEGDVRAQGQSRVPVGICGGGWDIPEPGQGPWRRPVSLRHGRPGWERLTSIWETQQVNWEPSETLQPERQTGKVPKKQRGGNGMRGGWDRGLRPASELVWGTLSSLLCSLADIQHRGLDLKYPELALHH